MKLETENLKALIKGIDLTPYQRALALNEWKLLCKFINSINILEDCDFCKGDGTYFNGFQCQDCEASNGTGKTPLL